MDADRLKIINDILLGKSTRLRESYFIKNYAEIHIIILKFCDIDIEFKQKIWHWVNNINTYFLCKCGNKTTFNKNWRDGYRKSCSPKCAQTDVSSKEKRKNTNLEKYGVDNVAKVVSIKEKKENTNLEKYGYKSSFSNVLVRDKWKKNMLDKYGVDHYFKTDDFKIKSKKYYLEKWGVKHQLNVDEIKDKIKNTCVERYGVSTYLNTDHARNSIRKYNRSSYEIEICLWLDKLEISYEINNRSIISPFSLDIYIPNFGIAIEFNGLYWHSELFKDKGYHLSKTNGCKDNGIQLIHIWEDDWLNRKDVIKSMLLNKLRKIDNIIYARKCSIRVVNNEDTSIFLNSSHIQGYTRFSDSIGLYFNNELVSLMCFGWRAINGNREYELIRFCNKINMNILGSASKLFKFFRNNNKDILNVVSYADLALFSGDLYRKLDFDYIKRSDINYWWVVDGVRKHRFNYNKKKLVKSGYDPLKTEVEIMKELGNFRIYGCGMDKYIWYRK